MHPKDLSIADYTYALPDQKIAVHPLAERDTSKLLIYKNGTITEDTYRHIAHYLPQASGLLFNNTKVVAARLLFEKPTGGVIEIFCLEPHGQYTDPGIAMLQQEKVQWNCLVGGASKWKHGMVLEKKIVAPHTDIHLYATYIEKKEGSFVIELSWTPRTLSFAELLHHAGAIPLPPYIKRNVEEADSQRYQTIYAVTDGSVAAPTAGLHFSNTIFNSLAAKDIQPAFVTLHVGAGTFKPVKSDTMTGHEMHAEFISVDKTTIEYLLEHLDDSITAVGTTSLRTIESLYWLGVKLANVHEPMTAALPELDQWEVYDHLPEDIPVATALNNLLAYLQRNNTTVLLAKTQIIIAPGYTFRIISALITNFHQPRSTLLLLVAALIGDDWRKVYDYALQHDFRFLSYGDGSLLWKTPQ